MSHEKDTEHILEDGKADSSAMGMSEPKPKPKPSRWTPTKFFGCVPFRTGCLVLGYASVVASVVAYLALMEADLYSHQIGSAAEDWAEDESLPAGFREEMRQLRPDVQAVIIIGTVNAFK